MKIWFINDFGDIDSDTVSSEAKQFFVNERDRDEIVSVSTSAPITARAFKTYALEIYEIPTPRGILIIAASRKSEALHVRNEVFRGNC